MDEFVQLQTQWGVFLLLLVFFTMHQMVGCFGKWRHWTYEYWEICDTFSPPSFIMLHWMNVDLCFIIVVSQNSWWAWNEEDADGRLVFFFFFFFFGGGHYLSWLSSLRLQSEVFSVGVSRTGLTKPSNSAPSSPSSGWLLTTKSFSHSRALESSEADGGPLVTSLLPGRSAARRMSSSVRDRSHGGSARLIPWRSRRRYGTV